jgi:hypothetical protein
MNETLATILGVAIAFDLALVALRVLGVGSY